MGRRIARATALFAVMAALIALFAIGASMIKNGGRKERLSAVETAIRRAVVNCYAIEGAYPESVKYMEENYGLRIDKSRYTVYYDIFASNVAPSITVKEVGGDADGG